MSEIRDNAIVRTALVRPVTMLMLFLSGIVIGIIALVNIPLELLPSGASAPFMSVEVNYPNATAQDVEEKISIPLEQALATTPKLDRITTNSRSDGSSIYLMFENDADMDVAYREIRDRIARVEGDLPSEVDQVRIQQQSADAIPVVFYGVRWPEGLDGAQDIIERHLIRKIERVEGVGLVSAWGQQEREIRIEVDRELAEAANLNIFEIAQNLAQSHFNLASGEIREAEGVFLVRSMASFETKEQLEETIVGPNDLRLDDVANVVYDYPESERHDRYKGQPTMALFAIKESQANTVDVCDAIKIAVDEAKTDPALAQFDIQPIFIQGDTIRTSLDQVVDSGLQGGLLAILVLIFFLRRVRLTVIIAGAIPLSMFLALPFMYFRGQSINLVSLIGLMICIGLVVDNSVVVAENIQRYRTRGMSRLAAALHGASEVALPVTLATATTMVVFLPAALLSSGQTQFFMVRMVTPVCVSLLASLFVALILIPLAAAFVFEIDLFKGVKEGSLRYRIMKIDEAWKRVLGKVYDATLGRLTKLYGKLLAASLRRRMDVVMVSLLAMASLAIPMNPETGVQFELQQNGGGRQVSIKYTIPSDVELEEADAFFRELEVWFDQHRDEYNADGEYIQIEPGYAQVQIFFKPPQDGDPPYREAGKEIFDQLPTPPGWIKRSDFGDSDGAAESAFPVVIFGDDHQTVQEVKEKLEPQLLGVEGVVSVKERGDSARRDELALSIDRGTAERYGVAAGVVGNTVAYALRGTPLPRLNTEEREIDVWIRYQKEDREQLEDLLEFKVPTEKGGVLPIKTLAEKNVQKGETTLVRRDKRVASVVALELDPDDRAATVARLQKLLVEYRLPEGVSFDADTEQRETDDSVRDLQQAGLLGLVFIFLLMGFLFESFVLPLSVVPAVPLSFVGVWWFLYITGSNMDPLAGIGVLLLLGVVVNNAIVLVDFINNARAAGVPRAQAVIQAGIQRFRPILMTALTTVGGMLPLAFAEAPAEGIPYGPFGKTLVGGMVTATVLTLIVVPVFYTMFDDLRELASDWWVRIRSFGKSKPKD